MATEILLKSSTERCGLAVFKVISIVQVIVSLLGIIQTNIVSIRYVCMESLYVFCWTGIVYFQGECIIYSGLGAIAAAVMSSTDSAILGSSSMFTHNVYQRVRPKVCYPVLIYSPTQNRVEVATPLSLNWNVST